MLQSSTAQASTGVTPAGLTGAHNPAARSTRAPAGLPGGAALKPFSPPGGAYRVSTDPITRVRSYFDGKGKLLARSGKLRIKTLNADHPVSLMARAMIELREDAYQVSAATLAIFGYTPNDVALYGSQAVRLARKFKPVLFQRVQIQFFEA
ncbi:MAG: hypothetical protein AB7I36_08400 [Rhodospirillaceae bacterium]